MMIPTKDYIPERLNTCFKAKSDDMRHSLSQLLLNLLGLKVTTPVVIPEETGTTASVLKNKSSLFISHLCV